MEWTVWYFLRVVVDLQQCFCDCIADLQDGSLMGLSSGAIWAGTIAVHQCPAMKGL